VLLLLLVLVLMLVLVLVLVLRSTLPVAFVLTLIEAFKLGLLRSKWGPLISTLGALISTWGPLIFTFGFKLGKLMFGRLMLGRLTLGRLTLGRFMLGKLTFGRLRLGGWILPITPNPNNKPKIKPANPNKPKRARHGVPQHELPFTISYWSGASPLVYNLWFWYNFWYFGRSYY